MSYGVPKEQLYQGGAASGVACCSCGTTSTSGSWRKGWGIEDTDEHANLCNRCGQRWAKCGRPTLAPGQELTPRRPAASTDRPRQPRSSGGTSGHLNSSGEPSYGSLPWGGGRGSLALSSFRIPTSSQGVAVWTQQRVTRGRSQHVLFWLHVPGDVSPPRLMAVGTDARSSGHYSYASVDASLPPGVPRLQATNRADVANWLAMQGVRPAAPDAQHRLPPPVTAEEWESVTVPAQRHDCGAGAPVAGEASYYSGADARSVGHCTLSADLLTPYRAFDPAGYPTGAAHPAGATHPNGAAHPTGAHPSGAYPGGPHSPTLKPTCSAYASPPQQLGYPTPTTSYLSSPGEHTPGTRRHPPSADPSLALLGSPAEGDAGTFACFHEGAGVAVLGHGYGAGVYAHLGGRRPLASSPTGSLTGSYGSSLAGSYSGSPGYGACGATTTASAPHRREAHSPPQRRHVFSGSREAEEFDASGARVRRVYLRSCDGGERLVATITAAPPAAGGACRAEVRASVEMGGGRFEDEAELAAWVRACMGAETAPPAPSSPTSPWSIRSGGGGTAGAGRGGVAPRDPAPDVGGSAVETPETPGSHPPAPPRGAKRHPLRQPPGALAPEGGVVKSRSKYAGLFAQALDASPTEIGRGERVTGRGGSPRPLSPAPLSPEERDDDHLLLSPPGLDSPGTLLRHPGSYAASLFEDDGVEDLLVFAPADAFSAASFGDLDGPLARLSPRSFDRGMTPGGARGDGDRDGPCGTPALRGPSRFATDPAPVSTPAGSPSAITFGSPGTAPFDWHAPAPLSAPAAPTSLDRVLRPPSTLGWHVSPADAALYMAGIPATPGAPEGPEGPSPAASARVLSIPGVIAARLREAAGAGGVQPEETLAALSCLLSSPIQIGELESSGLAPLVAGLRAHGDPRVAAAARSVSATWRQRAMQALSRATPPAPETTSRYARLVT